jgi:hypothetical protein
MQVGGPGVLPPEAASNLRELSLKGRVKELTEYEYESNRDTTGKLSKVVSLYDPDGNLQNKITYSSKGRVLIKCIYEHKNDTVLINQFVLNDKLANKLILKYDENRRLTEALQYTPPMTFVAFKTTFKYDKAGNEIEHDVYYGDNRLAESVSTFYNEKNQKTQVDHPAFNAKTLYTYDKSGYLIDEQTVSRSDKTVSQETKYTKFDKYGNWLMIIRIDDP